MNVMLLQALWTDLSFASVAGSSWPWTQGKYFLSVFVSLLTHLWDRYRKRWSNTLLNSMTKIQLAAGIRDTCDAACSQISHCGLKRDEIFYFGTYFLPAHAFWCLFSQMTSQVGSEAAGVQVPNGSYRRSLSKLVLPLPAKHLSKFPWRSVLALLCSARSSHVVPGLAWPLALAALSPLQQLIWSDKPKCLVLRDWEHTVLVDQLQLVAVQNIAGASSSWCSDSLLLLTQSVNFFWNKAAATVSWVICKKNDTREKYTEGEASFHDTVKYKRKIIWLKSQVWISVQKT